MISAHATSSTTRGSARPQTPAITGQKRESPGADAPGLAVHHAARLVRLTAGATQIRSALHPERMFRNHLKLLMLWLLTTGSGVGAAGRAAASDANGAHKTKALLKFYAAASQLLLHKTKVLLNVLA